MKVPKWVPVLFALAALYDGVLGLVFLVAPQWPFELFHVTPPNHAGYVQFPAALLLIFALLFVRIARAPAANRGLIGYGVLVKVAYCAVAGGHWLTAGIPGMFQPLVVVDLVMAALFVWAWAILRPAAAE